MKRTLVLDDDPTLQLALGLMLEKSGTEVVHLGREEALLGALDAGVCCVVVDPVTPGSELGRIRAAMAARAPAAGLVVLGPPPTGQVASGAVLWADQPYSQREEIAAFVRRCGERP